METQETSKSLSKRVILYDNKHPKKISANRLSAAYREDEAIVYLDKSKFPPHKVAEKIDSIKKKYKTEHHITIDDHQQIKCSNCDIDIPLFLIRGKGIHTKVADTLPGGTGPTPKTAGEYHFPNFLSHIPHNDWEQPNHDKKWESYKTKEETVTIAVLDTGIDTDSLVNPAYICDDFTQGKDLPCFSNVTKGGWNFLDNNDKYFDDNKGKHGSLVSQYIINQFKYSDKGVKIMPLKTHNKDGEADLTSIICAIHFAIAKGANIINASWGFYYYWNDNRNFLNFFKNLIGNELQKKGILFVTAAGNRIPQEDILAEDIYDSRYGIHLKNNDLRDLRIHKYFPAHLSHAESNIVTVTTTTIDGTGISPEQNYSNRDVDLGVKADTGENKDPGFKVPFKLSSGTIPMRGSSFATAIATGIIGAKSDRNLYRAGLKKDDFINPTGTGVLTAVPGMPSISVRPKLKDLIRNGAFISDYIK